MPAVQYGRSFDRAEARADQGRHPVTRQPGCLAPIRENHGRSGIRLIDGRDDVAVRHQLLDLEGVVLAKAEKPVQEDQHRVAGLAIGHGRGRDGVGGDVFQVTEGELRKMKQAGQRRRKRVGILHPGSARRGCVSLGWVPDLHHQLPAVIRIGGEDLRTSGIRPVVGQRADRIGSGRMREAEHQDEDRQSGGGSQPPRTQPGAYADGEPFGPAAPTGFAGRFTALQQPDQEKKPLNPYAGIICQRGPSTTVCAPVISSAMGAE